MNKVQAGLFAFIEDRCRINFMLKSSIRVICIDDHNEKIKVIP